MGSMLEKLCCENVGALFECEKRGEQVELLRQMDFLHISHGLVIVGSKNPLRGGVEGYRYNETPVREFEVGPFWLCKYKVTNLEFERFFPGHKRSLYSQLDKHPVVEVTYNEVMVYIQRLNTASGTKFRLPTELEWVLAVAPYGWEYPHGQQPDLSAGHVFGDGHEFGCVPIGDSRWESNWLGIDQMGYNTMEMTRDVYVASGHYGAVTDGAYFIAKGGAWGKCKFSPGVHRRRMFDVVTRDARLGFRLAHDEI